MQGYNDPGFGLLIRKMVFSILDQIGTADIRAPMTKAAVPTIISPIFWVISPIREKTALPEMINIESLHRYIRTLFLVRIRAARTGPQYTAPMRKLAAAPDTKTPISGVFVKNVYTQEDVCSIAIRG
jgi:hypothetical protein